MQFASNKMGGKSFLISLAIHGVIFIFLAVFVIGGNSKIQEVVKAILVPDIKPQKYEPRPQIAKPVEVPSVPKTQIISDEFMPIVLAKRSSPLPGKQIKTTAPALSGENSLSYDTISPSSLTKSIIAPKIMTAASVLPADTSIPKSVATGASTTGLGGNLGNGNDSLTASKSGRGFSALTDAPRVIAGKNQLSITRVNAALKVEDALAEVAKGVRLGYSSLPPLPKGEPGGVIIGRGKNMEGFIRFTRVKHFLADWWSDPSAMPGVMQWMNTQTSIHVDMNVEGGAATLDDPKLQKTPLAIMTGHDRSLLIGRGLKGNYKHGLNEAEKTGLRRYLLEAGGLLFFDACGHTLHLTNEVKSELRGILPEYSFDWIPNKHELYTCYYDLGGPPPGACRFWKHGGIYPYEPPTKYLEGIFINDRLAVIISDRDFLCGARIKATPGHGNTGEDSPSSYRFLANVIIYSLTHGGISVHDDYVPEMTDADKISIDAPVKVRVLIPE